MIETILGFLAMYLLIGIFYLVGRSHQKSEYTRQADLIYEKYLESVI